MKRQIKYLSPHQNGKVIAIMMTLISLVFFLPFMLIIPMFAMAPGMGMEGQPVHFPIGTILLMPVMYLVSTYISVALFCLVYNFIAGLVGGIEFSTESTK